MARSLKVKPRDRVPETAKAARGASSERLDTIEACRGIAALLVLLYHASAFVHTYFGHRPLFGLFDWGFAGIDFFFVLSGFVILWANQSSLGRPAEVLLYLRKRAWRIYPLYWLISLPIILAYFVLPISRQGGETALSSIVGSLTLAPVGRHPHLPVAWTLTQELLFYGLFAVLILNRRMGLAVLVAWQAATLANVVVGDTSSLAAVLLNSRNLHFGLGMLVAILLQQERIHGQAWQVAVASLSLVGLGLIWVVLGAAPTRGWWFGFALTTAVLIGCAAAWERRSRIRVPRPLLLLGAASYSLYLLHYPLELVLVRGFKALEATLAVPPWLTFWIVSAAALGCGIALHIVVERPLLRWGRRSRIVPARRVASA